ncbi:MAG: hypothetical protein O3B47_01135 [bacterium]|nr:hypothetical protein [bacterium]
MGPRSPERPPVGAQEKNPDVKRFPVILSGISPKLTPAQSEQLRSVLVDDVLSGDEPLDKEAQNYLHLAFSHFGRESRRDESIKGIYENVTLAIEQYFSRVLDKMFEAQKLDMKTFEWIMDQIVQFRKVQVYSHIDSTLYSTLLKKYDAMFRKAVAGGGLDLKSFIDGKVAKMNPVSFDNAESESASAIFEVMMIEFPDLIFKDGKKFFVKNGEDKFEIVPIADTVGGVYISLHLKSDPLVMVNMTDSLLGEVLKNGSFGECIDRAMVSRNNEKQNSEYLSGVDLPKDKKIAHIKFIADEYEGMMGSIVPDTVMGSVLMGAILEKKYPKLKSEIVVVYRDNALAIVKSFIDKELKVGAKMIILDLYDHGDSEKGFSGMNISPNEFFDLLESYPDVQFQINSIACFGAGLKDALMARKDLMKRVNLFVQTKSNMPNLVATMKQEVSIHKNFSTYYDLFLMQALLDGKSYGEAVKSANDQVKVLIGLDPEAVIEGRYIAGIGGHGSDLDVNLG